MMNRRLGRPLPTIDQTEVNRELYDTGGSLRQCHELQDIVQTTHVSLIGDCTEIEIAARR